MNRIYLDYAASTPVAPEVVAAMQPYFGEKFGNPSSLHWFGQEASAAVFRAREIVAEALACDYREIIFTGSATEANNLALRGATRAYQISDIRYQIKGKFLPRIITSAIEHESVLETCRALEEEGVEVIYIPVNREGIVDLQKLRAALNNRTVLVSVMHANNEIGVVQPIAEIAEIIREFRRSSDHRHLSSVTRHPSSVIYPLFHTDAAQSFQYLSCRVDELGVDLLTLSGQKIYGPKGIGTLYIRNQRSEIRNRGNHYLAPIITGSGQEWGLRAGTENTPLIVGFGKAVELAEQLRKKEAARVKTLRNYFWVKLKKNASKAELNGSFMHRLPNNLNVYFPGRPAGDLVIALDIRGIAASPGAACRSRAAKESYVIRAMGFSPERASQSVRFSFGRGTVKKDIDTVVKILVKIVK